MRLVKLNDMCYECDDYRLSVEKFVPEILNFIDLKEDGIIQKRFLDRMLVIHQAINVVGQFTTTVNERVFFDVIFDAIENSVREQELLRFINNCIKEVAVHTGGVFKNRIKSIIYKMIVNEAGSGFYTSVAELACFNEIFKNGKLKINDIERRLPNGKSVDIVVDCEGSDCFVDIVSIFFKEGKIHSNEDMYKFLHGRIAVKYEEKFHGIENKFLKDCGIMPVLWGELSEFKQYEGALQDIVSKYQNQIIPPYGLVYQKQNGYYFRPIKNIIKFVGIRKNSTAISSPLC